MATWPSASSVAVRLALVSVALLPMLLSVALLFSSLSVAVVPDCDVAGGVGDHCSGCPFDAAIGRVAQ